MGIMAHLRKPDGIFIEVEKPSAGTHFAGEEVTGWVTVKLSRSTDIEAITLYLEGNGHVCWSETENYFDLIKEETRTRKVNRKAGEHYVSLKSSLLKSLDNKPTTLPSGSNMYPFRLRIPSNCPSSFASKFGSVTYTLKAECKRFHVKSTKCATVTIPVTGSCDLNLHSEARESQKIDKVKGPNFLIRRKGEISFEVNLRRSGFVPGEVADFTCEIENKSTRKVSSVSVSLQQNVTFHSKERRKSLKAVVYQVQSPPVEVGGSEMWVPSDFVVPPVLPTGLGGELCKIIDVQYSLQFEMNVSRPSSSVKGELPIIIGTLPLIRHIKKLEQKSSLHFQFPPTAPPQSPTVPTQQLYPIVPKLSVDEQMSSQDVQPMHTSRSPPPSYFEAMSSSSTK